MSILDNVTTEKLVTGVSKDHWMVYLSGENQQPTLTAYGGSEEEALYNLFAVLSYDQRHQEERES